MTVGGITFLIADQHLASSEIIDRACQAVDGLVLLGIAHSRQMLMAKIQSHDPDLILFTPGSEMGGIDLVDDLKKACPDIEIVLIHDPDHDSDDLVKALETGVYECIEKPGHTRGHQFTEFRIRLLTITGLLGSRKRFSKKPKIGYKTRFFMPPQPTKTITSKQLLIQNIDVVVVAVSTGGPEILSRIFSILPGHLNVPILLVQHIPANMTDYFAKSLNQKSELNIFQAKEGDQIEPSCVYIAPGGQHMKVSNADSDGTRIIRLDDAPAVNSVRPSADILFQSVAQSYQKNILSIVLTGMGEDGKQGVAAIKATENSFCLTQKSETCVVYGMPKAVDEAGLSDESLGPLEIAQKITQVTQSDGSPS